MNSIRAIAALCLFALSGCPRTLVEFSSLSVTPDNARVARGESVQYVASALFSDGSVRDVTADALWSVDDEFIATVGDAPGVVRSLRQGQTVVRVRYAERTLTRPLIVGPAALRELQLDPPHPVLPVGLGVPLTVMAIDSDGAKREVTAEAVWTSLVPAIASMEGNAIVGRRVGATTLTASVEGLLATVPVDVTAATIDQLDVQPAAPALPLGVNRQLTATAVLSDGSSLDVTTRATWRSSAPAIAFASELPGEEGLVAARALGSAQVTATVLGHEGASDVTVAAATLTSLELSPSLATLAIGTSRRFTATGVFSNGTTADLSLQVSWASSNDAVFTVTGGLARAVSVGHASITASFGAVRVSRALDVTDAAVTTLELGPTPATVARGLTLAASAWGVLTDGSRQDLTGQVLWRVANPALASVSNAPGTSGRVTALAEGVTELSATVGNVTARLPLTISAADLLSVQVAPTAPNLPLGTRLPFTATGLFTDGSTQDLTAQATWASSAPARVSISSQGASRGEAAALALGPATVFASVGGRTGRTVATVTDAVLVRIDLTPAAASLPLGVTDALVATGVFSDGTVTDLTTQVTWRSSAPATLSASNAPGSQGEVRALLVGAATVTAQLGAMLGTAELQVTAATITRIELTPGSATIAVGLTRDFTVTATYSDASTLDYTEHSTFSTLAADVASVSNMAGSRGRVLGLKAGATRLFASAMGLEASADVVLTPATLSSLTITPPSILLARGTTATLRADATFSDGSTADVTTQVAWSSSDSAVATVANAAGTEGLVTTLTAGTATVHAQLGATHATAALTVTPATLDTIEVGPTQPSVPLGASLRLAATGRYSDGSAQDLSTQVTWASAAPGVASVSNTAGSEGLLAALAQGTTGLTATFGGKSGGTTVTVTAATLSRVELTPATPRLAKDTRIALHATGVWTDGATQGLTDVCVWASLAPAIATVSNASGVRGRVTGLTGGTVSITATCAGITGAVDVVVTNATLTAIELTPPLPTAAAGFTVQLTATGLFSDATTQPFSDFVSWSSADTTKATVSTSAGSEGLVLARAQGTALISATALGVTGSVSFTVSAAALQGLDVTPATASVPRGLAQGFVATGHFSDGTSAPITETATWSTTAPSIATVSNAPGTRGHTTALLEGTTTISAALSGFSASASLTVSPAALTTLTVTPATPSLAKGQSVQLTATGSFTDGSTRDLTASVTWSLADGAVANVSNAAGSRGLVQTLGTGATTVLASSGAVVGSTPLTVTPALLVSIGLTPSSPTVPRGLALQLTATGVYTDGTTADLTGQATWSSTDGAHVSVSNAPGSQGRVQALALGTATLSASFGGFSGTTGVTVSAAVLQRLDLTPSAPSVPAGLTTALVATGVYSDASTQDLSATASWSTGDATIATVAGGMVSAARAGSTVVFATVGSVTGSTPLVVSAALLQQVQVTPQNVSRPRGLTQQFAATGVYSDATTQDLTDSVTWASSDAAKVVVSNASGSRGLATTPGLGAVTLSATRMGVTGSTPFTVTAAQLTSLTVSPGNSSAPLGSVRQYVATGHYTDGSTQNLTAQATWSSSAPAVANISNAVGSNGLATTLSTGATSIASSFGGFSGSSNLVVFQTTLTRIDVSPAGGSTALGYSRQFIATGTYSDGTTQVLANATWSSSNENVALVSNAAGSRGLLSTVDLGTVSVTATFNAVSGSTAHTVTPAVLVLLSLAPGSLGLASGATAPVTATGYFSDGSMQNLTSSVTWTSTNPAVAQVSNAAGSEGLVSAISPGNSTVDAASGAVTASLNVVVN